MAYEVEACWDLIHHEIYCTYFWWILVCEWHSKIQPHLYNQQMWSIKWDFLGKKWILQTLNMGRFQSQVTVRSMCPPVMPIGCRLHEKLSVKQLHAPTKAFQLANREYTAEEVLVPLSSILLETESDSSNNHQNTTHFI
jgi:hypothetical protein